MTVAHKQRQRILRDRLALWRKRARIIEAKRIMAEVRDSGHSLAMTYGSFFFVLMRHRTHFIIASYAATQTDGKGIP